MNTVEVIKDIVRNQPYITGIYIHSFPTAPGLEKRLDFNEVEKSHYKSALSLRDQYNVPFWDALMLSFYNKKQFSERILQSVLTSHAKREKLLLSREQVLATDILETYQCKNENFAFNSEIQTLDKKKRHILLLDFHIPESDRNQIIAEKVLKLLKINKGSLLRSGRSYHFIGEKPVSTYSLISLVSKCLFFTPIIDKSWIAHQLIDKSCSVRFTKKNGIFPTMIKYIN